MGEGKPVIPVTRSGQDMKHKKDHVDGEYVMACFVLRFIAGRRKEFCSLFAMNVPKRRHSSTSADAAAVADDVSIANAFVTLLFAQGWVVCRFPSLA